MTIPLAEMIVLGIAPFAMLFVGVFIGREFGTLEKFILSYIDILLKRNGLLNERGEHGTITED